MFKVKVAVSKSGERHPLVWDDAAGIPVWWPNVWLAYDRRITSVATSTLAGEARVVASLENWAIENKVNLTQRMLAREWLDNREQTSLVEYFLTRVADRALIANARKSPDALKREPIATQPVGGETSCFRLAVAADYLCWLYIEGAGRLPEVEKKGITLEAHRLAQDLRSKLRHPRGRNNLGRRVSPPEPELKRLFQVIEIGHRENPWSREHLAMRNRLLIHLFYHLGLRLGEALGLKCQDILHLEGLVQVLRRPDDPEDPRPANPARQKTRERIIPCNTGLMQQLVDYIDLTRDLFPGARRHSYVICSHSGPTTGTPLSLEAPGKVLERLGTVPGVPAKLHPHILRHAWNATFSRMVDEIGLDAVEAGQLRSYLMGWSSRSGTAATYDVRHLQEAAMKLSLRWQEMMYPPAINLVT